MEQFWSILEIEPTRDTGAIKRAYARLAGKYHPEEEPEKFLQLRKAYQAALAWAEDRAPSEPQAEPDSSESGWQLHTSDQNPYRNHALIRHFVEIYTGKQRRNPKTWMDFFTSYPFLDVMREPDFTAQLLEEVLVEKSPPSREFLTWLSIAYQYTQKETMDKKGQRGREFQIMQGAQFYGLESILQIALLGPKPKPFAGNELAMLISYFEYNRLNALADAGNWNESAVSEASRHISRYNTSYLQEKCQKQQWNEVERHPMGLRLLEHFFRRRDLPEELYRILWHKLNLKSAILGRAKVLYQNLRELVLERVPGIDRETEENFYQLNREQDAYCTRIQKNPEREEEESAAFFAREDVQNALRSRRFIDEQLLSFTYWLSDRTGEGFLRRLLPFYQENSTLPYAEQVVEKVSRTLREREVKLRNQEDRNAPGVEYYERLTLAYRPYFRHWLNTGFYTARDPESGIPLLAYLNQNLPYLPEWSRRFLTKPDGSVQPRTVAVSMGTVEIVLHQRYMEFFMNGQPVYRPCLSWEQACAEGGEWFLYLLPITMAAYHQYEEVRQSIFQRLSLTAAPREDREQIAACLAGMVCRIPDEPEESPPLPLELFAEDSERLYGAAWFAHEGLLLLFEQSFEGRRVLPDGEYHQLFEEQEALSKARQLLENAASPKNYDLSLLEQPPKRLYALPLYPPEAALEKDVSLEVTAEYLGQFAEGKLRRLELEWYSGSLVFVKDHSCYACFFFESGQQMWYTMISQPDIYQNVEHDEVRYIPFGMGKLAEYVVFYDTASLMSRLDLVFIQIGRGHPQTRVGGHWLWSTTVNLHDAAHKLVIAKQKLAGFPPNRCQKYILTKFLIHPFPVELESVTTSGERTLTAMKSGTYGQVSAALIQFIQKKLTRLRLTWAGSTPEGDQRHLVLLQDSGRYMMAWLQDKERRARFYTTDEESGPCTEETFYGRTVPAYLVHHHLERIRNCLDLMLDDMSDPSPVTDRPGEFVPENPENPWPYEEIYAELVKTEQP